MRIAIVKLSALGDIVNAMVVLQFIKKSNKEIIIDWVVDESFKELLDFHPQINNVHVINLKKAKKKKSFLTLFKDLGSLKKLSPYDLVIDMQGLIKSAIVSRLIPSLETVGYDKFSIREKAASMFYSKTYSYAYDRNIVERNISLISFALGIKITKEQIQNKTPFLYTLPLSNTNTGSFKKNIILIPGASFSSKRYPAKKYAEITTLIDANFFVIWGNELEKALAYEIKKISPTISISPKLSINELKSLISDSDLVIGSDTGPTHMAFALNCPSITLFGSTPGYRNAFQTKINKIIESDSIVNPFKINKNDYSIANISVKEIVKIAKLLL